MDGFIDIGSNSVRLMLYNNGKTVDKFVKVTKLSEGLLSTGFLQQEPMRRTVSALKEYQDFAKENGAENLYAFATAAVRQAKNGQEFVKKVLDEINLKIDVVSGETEAKLGLTGVLKGFDGGIIDIGGASSEVAVVLNGKTVYSHSLPLGVVKLREACKNDYAELDAYAKEKVLEYGKVPCSKMYGIGGTATQIAAVALKLKTYDRNKVNGYVLTEETLDGIIGELNGKTLEQIMKIDGVHPDRADVIFGGAILLKNIFKHLSLTEITVSEDDNLEGYAISMNGENNE